MKHSLLLTCSVLPSLTVRGSGFSFTGLIVVAGNLSQTEKTTELYLNPKVWDLT